MGPRLHTSDELNFALRQYLATSHEPTKKEALDQAARVLVSPKQILDNPLLADTHRLKTEALTVSDAFEAVTNGMENPEAMAALDALGESSLFQPWKAAILSLKALYAGDSQTCLSMAGAIPGDSPVHRLVPLLKNLCGVPARLDRRAKDFLSKVEDRQDSLSSGLDQLKEALVTGLEEVFFSLFVPVLEDLVREDREAAAKLTLWAVGELEKYDLDYEVLFEQIRDFWGPAEGSRLIALGLYPVDPEAALLFWLGFLRELPQDHIHTAPAMALLKRMTGAVRSFQDSQGEGEGFSEDFRAHLSSVLPLHPGLKALFPDSHWNPGNSADLPPSAPASKSRGGEKHPVQLDFFELFAS